MRFSKLSVVVAVFVAGVTLPARAEFMDLLVARDDVGEAKSPTRGTSRVLVIPVEVRNAGFAPLQRQRVVDFFETESESAVRFPSYFRLNSGERYVPEAVVAPTLVFDGCPASLGVECTVDRTDLAALQVGVAFMRTVIARADGGCWLGATACESETAIDFGAYDMNGRHGTPDGWIDGVIIHSNVPGMQVSLPLYRLNGAADGDLSGGDGGPFELDGVKLGTAALCGDTGRTRPEYGCLNEFSNLLGAADLHQETYWAERHTSDVYPGYALSSVGAWAYDENVPMLDAETRYRLGWADVEVVSGTQRLTLFPSASGGRVAKLGMRIGNRDEYFLAEVRGPVGAYDRGVVGSRDGTPVFGLSVTRVDWNEGPTGQPGSFAVQLVSCLNCDPWHPFLQNIQADGRWEWQQSGVFRAEEDLFRPGDAFFPSTDTRPFSEASPVWGANFYDGTSAGIEIRNLAVDATTGAITADFVAPTVADPCADLTCLGDLVCEEGNCIARQQNNGGSDGGTVDPDPVVKPPPTSGWGCQGVDGSVAGLLAGLAAWIEKARRRRARLAQLAGNAAS